MPSKTAEHIRQQHQRILELRDENFKLRIQMDKLRKENDNFRKKNYESSKSESETLKLAIKVSRFELEYLSAIVEEKRKELREMDALEMS